MKNTIILLIVLLALLTFWFFMGGQQDKKMGYDISDRQFAIENVDDIGKIVIVSKRQDPTMLTKEKGNWYIGKEKKLASKNVIKNLLKVVQNVRMMYIPARQAQKNILNELSLIGVKVLIYDKNNKLIKSYLVGGSPQDELGTYMLMDGSLQPYTMHLPGLKGSIRGRYEMKNIDWRDRAVMRYTTSDIDNIKVSYPKNKMESFSIQQKGNSLDLSALDPYRDTNNDIIDYNKVKSYFEGFDEVYSEYIENSNQRRDAIADIIPFCKILVESNGNTDTYDLFPMGDLIYQQETADVSTDMKGERYFVNSSSGDFFLVQNRLIKKLLRGYSFFTVE